ncbi:hypothetical protein Syun_022674 [Stephania yunnanensis]|uniref:Uncharacterized protein n=1 Tax=Stephania yunnanensis TaxID=152371 RepID=A0AAP0HYS2_9MAGN
MFIFQGMATIGNSFFFLGSRLGDSLLVQYTCGLGASSRSSGYVKEESEKAILRDQEEREQLERNIRNRDAAATKKL